MRSTFPALLAAAGVLVAVVNAQTTCPDACPAIDSPVCGSDGQTYGNECEFDIVKCQSGDDSLTIVAVGKCPSSSGSDVDACAQDFACLEIYDPVCGSDGVTYGNSCELKLAQCSNSSLTQASEGECPSSSGSDVDACEQGFACEEIYDPVCGSDGVTYGNSCELKLAQCSNSSLTQVSEGKCTAGSVGSDADDGDGDDSDSTPDPSHSACV